MQQSTDRIIMCDIVNHVLIPSQTGSIPVKFTETINPDNSRSGAISFGGGIQGFVTYGVCNLRPVSWMVSVPDPMGYVHRSFENIIRCI